MRRPSAWLQADDGFDRTRQTSETHYFECAPPCTLDVPAGRVSLWVQHGFAHAPWRKQLELAAGRDEPVKATLQPEPLPAAFGDFISADLHIHMNYGGHYRNTPAHLARQARAEDLDLAWDLVVNKEERVPDIASFRTDADPASTPRTLVLHGQEYHTSFWGHLGLLHLTDHFLTPDFAAYRHTAMASPYPTNGGGRGPGACAGRAGRLRASVRRAARSRPRRRAQQRAARRRDRTARSTTSR